MGAFVHTGPALTDLNLSGGTLLSPETALDQMGPAEFAAARFELPVFALAFRSGERFELRWRSRWVNDQLVRYDRDFMELVLKGNGHPDVLGRDVSLSGFGLHSQTYLDHGLSVGFQVLPGELWAGVGVHWLQGQRALQTSSLDATWNTDALDLTSSIAGNAEVYAVGMLPDSFSFKDVGLLDFRQREPYNDLDGTLSGDQGIAVDVGMSWKVSSEWEVEGAVEGWGRIWWTGAGTRYDVTPEDYLLLGVQADGSWGEDSVSIAVDSVDATSWLGHWIGGILAPRSGPSSFETQTRSTWRLGARYRPASRQAVAVYGQIYRQSRFGRGHLGFVLGGTRKWGDRFLTDLHLQQHAGRWFMGGGVSLRTGPFRTSLALQGASGVSDPMAATVMMVQAGLTLDFGYRPLTESEYLERQYRRNFGSF